MPKAATVFDVLISCPGDVSQFVPVLEEAIQNFNSIDGRRNDVVLRPVNWAKNAYPEFGDHPQKILNKQIVDPSDFAVAVFWTRFGTKTEDFGSGTEEEIERMRAHSKQVFLYFLDKPVPPSKYNPQQSMALQEFRKKHEKDCLVCDVSDEHDLANKFHEHLSMYIEATIHGPAIKEAATNKLILWVDDCPENNVYVRNILESYGLKFDLALSTERALNLMRNNDYSLVISDMGRKEGPREGYVLLERMRSSGSNVPFIIFSASSSSPEKRAEAAKNGAQCSTNTSSEVVSMVLKLLLNP